MKYYKTTSAFFLAIVCIVMPSCKTPEDYCKSIKLGSTLNGLSEFPNSDVLSTLPPETDWIRGPAIELGCCGYCGEIADCECSCDLLEVDEWFKSRHCEETTAFILDCIETDYCCANIIILDKPYSGEIKWRGGGEGYLYCFVWEIDEIIMAVAYMVYT